MLESIRQLQEETETLGRTITTSLTGLREDMKREFEEQRRINEEQRRINEEHGRIIARQGACFDQALAGVIEQFDRNRSVTGIIWSTLMKQTAEMTVDFETMKADTADLKRRMAAVEKRLAG